MRLSPRIRILLALLWVAVAATAVNHWYETPVELPSGLTVIDVVDELPDQLLAHARCAVDPVKGGSWGLAWDVTDNQNMTRAILSFPPHDVHDDMRLNSAVVLSVERITDGRVDLLQTMELSSNIDRDGGFNSIKIAYVDGAALLSVGAGHEAASLMVPLGDVDRVSYPQRGAAAALYALQPVMCQRLQAESERHSAVAMSRYTDYDSLLAHILESVDPMEGFWRYLDRNVDTAKATLGGVYTIATVADGAGYQIIYIDGAEIDSAHWSRMALKGRLRPTPFVGNYDMDWYTSAHLLLDSETNAQVADDYTILTCRFPLLNSSIRFARLPLAPQ